MTHQAPYNDISDNLAGSPSHDGADSRDSAKGLVIHFLHIPTGATCHFKAFITSFEDAYESQWNEEEVFGRMDPISTFKRTRRRIRLGWDIPAASEEEAILNLKESEKLLSMLYPVYEDRKAADFVGGGANGPVTNPAADQRIVSTMAAPPLFKIKFSNLIMDSNTGAVRGDAASSGLVGTIAGLNYRPDIEQGFFGQKDTLDFIAGRAKTGSGALVPQTLSFDIDFVVHHTHKLGFRKRVREDIDPKSAVGFPYASNKILK